MDKRPIAVITEALGMLKSLDADMPVSQALSLLLIASNEGLSLKELAHKTEIGMASASRYVANFGKATKPGVKGLGLVASVEDPMERRKKIITLTSKGRVFVNKLTQAE